MSELSVWTPCAPTRRRKCTYILSDLIGDAWCRSDDCLWRCLFSPLSIKSKLQQWHQKHFKGKLFSCLSPILYQKIGDLNIPMVSVPVFEISLGGLNITQRGWLWRDEHFTSLSFFIASCRWIERKREKQTQAPQIHVKPVTLFWCQVWPKFSLAALTEGLCVLTVDANLFWKSCLCCSD